jgi:CheY-like chemotaxis protein
MFAKEITVLAVDDEPDVLSVTTLALRNMKVGGLPLKVYAAKSKAEAIELLNGPLGSQVRGISRIAVAFIDVVMETEHAGLELCEYIRETMGNKITQIYVRTGQPGVAPERAVIDGYDITGYLSKVEATEDKLYSLVRAGIRSALVTGLSLGLSEATGALINASRSREQMSAVLTYFVASLQRDPQGEPLQNVDIRMCCISDGQVIGGDWNEDDADALAVQKRLGAQPGTPVGTSGDTRYVTDGNDFLIQVAASPETADMAMLARGTVPAPAVELQLLARFTRALAALWQHAATPEREPVTA